MKKILLFILFNCYYLKLILPCYKVYPERKAVRVDCFPSALKQDLVSGKLLWCRTSFW